jgi:hypothetical protein
MMQPFQPSLLHPMILPYTSLVIKEYLTPDWQRTGVDLGHIPGLATGHKTIRGSQQTCTRIIIYITFRRPSLTLLLSSFTRCR